MALPGSAVGERAAHTGLAELNPSHTHFPNGVFVRTASDDVPSPGPFLMSP